MEKTWTAVGTCQLLRAGTATSPARATFYQAHESQKTTSQAWYLFSYPNFHWTDGHKATWWSHLLAILLPTGRVNFVPCLSLSSALERQSWSPWDVGDKGPQGTPKVFKDGEFEYAWFLCSWLPLSGRRTRIHRQEPYEKSLPSYQASVRPAALLSPCVTILWLFLSREMGHAPFLWFKGRHWVWYLQFFTQCLMCQSIFVW